MIGGSPANGRSRHRGARARRALLLLGLLALLGWAMADDQDYYPAQAGMSWTYSSGETQEMHGPRDFGGVQVMVLIHYLEGIPVSEDYLYYGEQGVLSLGTAMSGSVVRYDPPLLVYATSPLQPGQSWSSSTEIQGMTLTLSSEVLGMRGVQTSLGRFNALQIRQTTLTSTGARAQLDVFLVPGMGVIRFVTQDGTQIDLIDLVR